jgi:membrane protein DedA with SNARE-associated domain
MFLTLAKQKQASKWRRKIDEMIRKWHNKTIFSSTFLPLHIKAVENREINFHTTLL